MSDQLPSNDLEQEGDRSSLENRTVEIPTQGSMLESSGEFPASSNGTGHISPLQPETEGFLENSSSSATTRSVENLLGTGSLRRRQQVAPPRQNSLSSAVLCASSLAALGGVLFGYDIGIISGAMLQLKEVFALTCVQRELIVASMLFGALLASFCGGFIVDLLGRRVAIMINSGIFVGGAVVLAVSNSFFVLVCGRLMVGFAVALSATAECVYISEIAPARRRGLLVSLNELGITLGFLLAYFMNYVLIETKDGWRYMFGLSAIPAAIQGLGMLPLPESPRFLLAKVKIPQARRSLCKLRGHSDCDRELNQIKAALLENKKPSVLDLCRPQNNMRCRLLLGIGLVFFQQFTGQPNVLYYAPTIFQSVGFPSNQGATLASVGLGAVKVFATLISLLCVDRAGRRKFLLGGTTLMTVGIITLGVVSRSLPSKTQHPCDSHQSNVHNHSAESQSYIHHVIINSSLINDESSTDVVYQLNTSADLKVHQDVTTSNSSQTRIKTIGKRISPFAYDTNFTKAADPDHNNGTTVWISSTAERWLALTGLMLFVAGYAVGFGPVSWLVLSEIFPTPLKGRAISLATTFNWGTNLIISFTFLNFISAVGVSATFLFYGAVCMLSLAYIYTFIPETRGRTLEDISSSLQSVSVMQTCAKHCCCCCKDHDTRRRYIHVRLTEDETSNL